MEGKYGKGDTTWFVRDRFGLFIHWGIYALPARHEWVKQYEKIPDEIYETYFRHFDPDLYDPELWAKAAANAGMKYFVVTTKHHDGFCLWDSPLTDYKAPKTPAGRDLLTPMVEAFRRNNLKVGLYHSLIDWHHPDFVIDDIHAMRDHPKREEWNRPRDQKKYTAYLHGQVRELLTRFGHVDILWFDFSYPPGMHVPPQGAISMGKGRDDWKSAELVKMIRELQPHVILDDRLDLPGSGDIVTPEQVQPTGWVKVDGKPVVWEACQTLSGSWGYHRDEESWKSVDQLIWMLIDTVSKGGNFILNVGPTGRGEFDERALARLNGMGEWMKRHGRSIYGCTQAPEEFSCPRDCRFTCNPETKRLYLHVLAWPFRRILLEGFAGRIEYTQLLNDASEIKHLPDPENERNLFLEIPVKKPNVTVPVVEMFLK